jgi:hypothetical protein
VASVFAGATEWRPETETYTKADRLEGALTDVRRMNRLEARARDGVPSATTVFRRVEEVSKREYDEYVADADRAAIESLDAFHRGERSGPTDFRERLAAKRRARRVKVLPRKAR